MLHPFRNLFGLEIVIIICSLIPYYRIIKTITIPSLIQTSKYFNDKNNNNLSSVYKVQTKVINQKLNFNIIKINNKNDINTEFSSRIRYLDEIFIEIIKLLLDKIIDFFSIIITFFVHYGSIFYHLLYEKCLYIIIFVYHIISNNPSLVNIQIHSMNTIILYKLSVIILSYSSKRYYSQFISRYCSLIGIIYFAVHPSRIPFITNSYVSSNIYTFFLILGTYLFFLYGKFTRNDEDKNNDYISYLIFGIVSFLTSIVVIVINTSSPILIISSIIPIVAIVLIFRFIFDTNNNQNNISSNYLMFGIITTLVLITVMSSKLISIHESTIRNELLKSSQLKDIIYNLYNSGDINNYLLVLSGVIDSYGEQFWPSYAFNNNNNLINKLNISTTMVMNSYLVKNGIITWKHLFMILSNSLSLLLKYVAQYVDEHDILLYFNIFDNTLTINDNPFEYVVRIVMFISLFFIGLYFIRSLLFILKLLLSFTSPRNKSYIFILWIYSLLCIPTAISNFIRVNPSYGHEIECNKLISSVLLSPNKKAINNNNKSLVFTVLPSNNKNNNTSWKWGWTDNSKVSTMSQICPQQLYFNCYIPASFFCILLC